MQKNKKLTSLVLTLVLLFAFSLTATASMLIPANENSLVFQEQKIETKLKSIIGNTPIPEKNVFISNINHTPLGKTKTDSKGNFKFKIDYKKIKDGYILSMTGSTISNINFSGELNAVYNSSHTNLNQSNITLATSLIYQLAKNEKGNELKKRDTVITKLANLGVIQKNNWFKTNTKNVDQGAIWAYLDKKSLEDWFQEVKEDLKDNDVSIQNQIFFPLSHGKIKNIYIEPSDSIAIFPGENINLLIRTFFTDEKEDYKVKISKIKCPSWVSIKKNIINIHPAESESNFKPYKLSLNITANNTKIGRTKDVTIELIKPIVLLQGTLGKKGGRIANEWQDINMNVDANKLLKNYKITYFGGIDCNGHVVLRIKTEPQMSAEEMAEITLNEPSYNIIKENYLLNDE